MDQAAQKLSTTAFNNLKQWLESDKYAEFRPEIEQLLAAEAWDELEDGFFKVLEFGTAGRRGKTGAGPNRINKITIGESTQGFCDYLASQKPINQAIVIAYDTRITSQDLAKYAAQVAAANDFKVYLFDGFRSTPELSFMVRHLQAAAGIVISASHNPPQDNGFKAYWSDGGQLVNPHAKAVLEASQKVVDIRVIDFEAAIEAGKIELLGAEADQAYYEAVLALSQNQARDLKLVYSPLHGAGQRNVLPVLQQAGFTVDVVEAQMTPDGNFPTISDQKPNPENPNANQLAVEQLLATEADLAITTDPDADRLAVVVNRDGQPRLLTGNQTAALIADYLLSKLSPKARQQAYLAKTIVTTDLLADIAKHYQAQIFGDHLVGFKYIGQEIESHLDDGLRFLMGGEESYGVLVGDYARDKDAASGVLPICELAAELKLAGKDLFDQLLVLFERHGWFNETLNSLDFPGATGFQQMQDLMLRLRQHPPTKITDQMVTAIRDYSDLTIKNLSTGEQTSLKCSDTGNVLVFEFGDPRCRLTIRPSGTEPKIKLYLQWWSEATGEISLEQLTKQQQAVEQLVAEMKAELID